jgi:sulfite oxidase
VNRRNFTKKAGLLGISSLVATDIVFSEMMPKGYVPLVFQDSDPFAMFKKDKQMVVLNDRPWNIEAQAHLLNDAVTPNKYMFIRNNGLVPDDIQVDTWKLTIDGEAVQTIKSYFLTELKTKFKQYTYQLTLECGGNGRSEFDPPAKGNQWTVGAVSCAQWTGVRLRDVLEDVGLKDNAVYVGYYGADQHLTRNPDKIPISRGVPLKKAMEEETLLAFQMNGEDIPLAHGYPLRLVIGGWPASVSGKWLQRLSIRNKVHDGEKMQGSSYRVPCETVAPGEKVSDEAMCIIESMPVKSLITSPKTGAMIKDGKKLGISGHAWAGDLAVKGVEYSIDFGSTWQPCALAPAANRMAWQHFQASVAFPKKGYYEIWARAEDSQGKRQPMVLPGWNPKGYLNNACHRIAIKVV